LHLAFEYRTALFDPVTITRMARHFEVLLTAIVRDPNTTLAQLPLLTVEEQQSLIRDFNAIHTDFPSHLCIHRLFEQQVERTPHAAAVVFGNQSLSYLDLNSRANQLTQGPPQPSVR